ncbi:MAG: hypothetical protein KDA61_04210, partial [Planctomycetales bacterium]|nr:hypothetical protein [Planctomycetales bacterium]
MSRRRDDVRRRMKNRPCLGYFAHWPQDGDDWIHPDDVLTARDYIPSERVFRREESVDGYFTLHYGEVQIRVLPALWQEVESEGFAIGDWVEVLSHGGRQRPHTGQIRE